jgi:protein O-mannosyl-transferase
LVVRNRLGQGAAFRAFFRRAKYHCRRGKLQNFLRRRIALCLARKIAYKRRVSQPRRIGLLLALVTLAVYLPVARLGFCVYDDGLYVTENPIVQAGVTWAGLKYAFTTLAIANWHPLTLVSHMIDCGVFGLNPAGPHLENALIHAANAALLFVLLFRLTAKIWPTAFIAALFAWHPMHVESVAWISERKDVLSTFFALLALINYARFGRERGASNQEPGVCSQALPTGTYSVLRSPFSKFYWVALLCFALGLMTKPMLVTLPCVLLLLDFWPLQRISNFKFQISNLRTAGALVVEKIPFFLCTAAASLVTFIAQSRQSGKAVVSLENLPLLYRLKNIPVAYAEYLWKNFWPDKLAIFYPLPGKIYLAQTVTALVVLISLSAIALRLHRPRPYLLTGWFWFLGMLVPVIGLVQVGGAQIANRYTYLPSVGLFLAATCAVLDLAAHWQISKKILAVAAMAILLACVAATENQLGYWQTNITLFQHALAVTADNEIARNNLGVALEQQGRLAEAAEHYRAAAKLETANYQGHHNLARVLDRLGRPVEALAEHREAARLGTNVQFLRYSLGVALNSAGQTAEALQEFSEAARLDPHYPWPHLETAKIFLRQNREVEALNELRAAVRIDPNNADILTTTARVLAAAENAVIRDGQFAFVLAAKANLLTGGTRSDVLDVMGMACAEMGKFDEAQTAAQQAINLAMAAQMKDRDPLRQRLELYQNHRPWREAFGATNAAVKN